MTFSLASWTEFDIPVPGGIIRAKEQGMGQHLLLCLHGFGENRHAFDQLLKMAPRDWVLVSVDLPLFGQSQWLDSQVPIKDQTWQAMIHALQDRYPRVTWHILGYSMGGKIALKIQEFLPQAARTIVVVTPDGLKRHPAHHFVTHSLIGKWLFQKIMLAPTAILKMNQIAYRLGLIDRFLYRFVNGNFGEKRWRERVYLTIRLYEGFHLNWDKLARVAEAHGTNWLLIWGQHDPTFSQQSADRMLRFIPQTQTWQLDGGHMLLRDQIQEIRNLLHTQLFDSHEK